MFKVFTNVLVANGLVLAFVFLVGASVNVLAQDYPNSVASTDFDYIHSDDPSAFKALKFVAEKKSEMPDKRGERELFQPSFVFQATFTDGSKVNLALDEKFKTKEAAEKEAKRYTGPLGRLPSALRHGVKRVVVHQGGRDTTAFSDVGLIVVYSDNASKRISNHDLEETFFHESVHAAWDKKHATSKAWKRAQAQDGVFVTTYAKKKPDREDLAESALFAYTLVHHPKRIPAADAQKIKKAIPARIRFVAELIPPDKPIFYSIEKKKKASTDSDEDK